MSRLPLLCPLPSFPLSPLASLAGLFPAASYPLSMAIARANDSMYSLGAAVFTEGLDRAHRVASDIEAVMAWLGQ